MRLWRVSDQLKLILTLSTHFCPSLVQVRLSRETNTKCVRLSLMASCTWLAASTIRTIMASTGKILCNKRGASKAAVFVASRTYLLSLTPAAVPPWWAPRRPCYAPEFNGREHVTHMIWILTRQIICRTCEKKSTHKDGKDFHFANQTIFTHTTGQITEAHDEVGVQLLHISMKYCGLYKKKLSTLCSESHWKCTLWRETIWSLKSMFQARIHGNEGSCVD